MTDPEVRERAALDVLNRVTGQYGVILLHPSVGLGVASMHTGTILVITVLLPAILPVTERRRRA